MGAAKLSAVLLLVVDSAAGLVAGVDGLSRRSVAHCAGRAQSPVMNAPVCRHPYQPQWGDGAHCTI